MRGRPFDPREWVWAIGRWWSSSRWRFAALFSVVTVAGIVAWVLFLELRAPPDERFGMWELVVILSLSAVAATAFWFLTAWRPEGLPPETTLEQVPSLFERWARPPSRRTIPLIVGVVDQEANFIGKDALRRIREEGVDRRLVGVEIRSDPLDLNETKWPVYADGEAVGVVTSAVHSPRLERNIGYAMVPVALAEVGTALTVETSVGPVPAVVAPMPFIDPRKEIPRGRV